VRVARIIQPPLGGEGPGAYISSKFLQDLVTVLTDFE
jgi:hypothetical protein